MSTKRYKDGDRLHAGVFNKLLNDVENLEYDVDELKKKKDNNTWRPVKINGNEILDNKPEKPLVLNGSENITLSTNNDVITITSNGYVYSESKNSVADGYDTTANGKHSHTEGYGTVTTNEAEHAEGKYNISNAGTIHSIGIGDATDNRMNAVEVMQNGDMYLLGVGNYDGVSTYCQDNNVQTLQEVINGAKQSMIVVGGESQSNGIHIKYSSKKYIDVTSATGNYAIYVWVEPDSVEFNGVNEKVIRFKNSTGYSKTFFVRPLTKSIDGSSITPVVTNMYDAALTANAGAGVTVDDGKTIELIFTFWGLSDVTFNGGLSV